MPIDCNKLPTEEERAQCILIQNQQAALRKITIAPIPSAAPACAAHLRAAADHVHHADQELTKALEALHHREG